MSGVTAPAQQTQFPLAAPAGVDSKAREQDADTQGKPEIGPFAAK